MIKIYGSSDDLIEIEGDINAEFMFCETRDYIGYVGLSSGMIFTVSYDKRGMWRIHPIGEPNTDIFEKTEGTNPDDDYSDIITVHDDIRWVTFGIDAEFL